MIDVKLDNFRDLTLEPPDTVETAPSKLCKKGFNFSQLCHSNLAPLPLFNRISKSGFVLTFVWSDTMQIVRSS